MTVGTFVFVSKLSKGISAFNRNKLLRLEIEKCTNLAFDINEFIFVIIESKHIDYSLSMTHKIASVLLQIIRLKTLTPDLLNRLYYPEQILPFSQVNYLSQCRVEKT